MNDSEIQTLLAKFDLLSSTYLRDEVDEALNHQEALTPHLLRIIEDAAENPLRQVLEEHNAHVYAATLLSHFREPAAHLPLVRAFSVAPEPLADLWGDMTTETLPTLLYNTCDGSIEAIKELVEELDPEQFWQIHRATIVNVKAIAGVSRDLRGRQLVQLKNYPQKLEVSRNFTHLFKQM